MKNSSKIPQLQSLSVVAKDEDGKEPKKPEFEEGEEIPSQSADEISTVPPIPVLKTPRRVQTSPKWKKRNKSQKKDFAHVVKAFGATYAGNQRQPIEKDDIMNCDQYVFKESPYYGNEAQIMRASTEDNNLSSLMKDFESHANDNDLRSCLSTANRSKRYYKMYNVNQIANWNKIGYAKCELHASRMRKRFENTIKHRQIKSMDENEPITPVSSKYSQVLSFQGRTKEDDPSQYDFQFESNQPQTQAHNHRKKGEKQKTEPFMEFDIDIIERSQIELNSEAHSSFIEKNPKKSSTPLNLSNTSSPSKPNNHPSEPAQSKSHSSSQHKKATKTDKDKEITPNHSKTQKNSISEILATPNHTYPENEAKHPLFLKKKKAFGRKRSLETTTHTKRSPKTGCAASAGGIGEKRNMRTIDLDRGDSAKKREGGFVIRKSKKKNKGNRSRSPKARNMNQLENACRNRNGGIRLLIQKRRENYAFNHSLQLYQPANRGKQLWNFSNTNQRLNPLNKSMQSPKQINKRHSLFKKLMVILLLLFILFVCLLVYLFVCLIFFFRILIQVISFMSSIANLLR